MRGRLLERDAELRRLQETLRRAGRGLGSVVLVSGEVAQPDHGYPPAADAGGAPQTRRT